MARIRQVSETESNEGRVALGTQDLVRQRNIIRRQEAAERKRKAGGISQVSTVEQPTISAPSSTSAAQDFAKITKSQAAPEPGFVLGRSGRLERLGSGPTLAERTASQIGAAQLKEDEARRRLERSRIDEANLRLRQEKELRAQGRAITQPKRDRLERVVKAEERQASIAEAQAGVSRGSVAEERKQLRADSAQARLEAIGAEEKARTAFQIARAQNASQQRVEALAKNLRILSEDRARVEQEALDFERQIATEERQAVREREALQAGREADFVFDQVKKGNVAVLDSFSDEQLASAGLTRDFVETISQTLPPAELADIDASASKLLGKIIRKDGTFVLGDDNQPLSFSISEQDKTRYQSSFNPVTGDQIIFNPTTGEVIQRIDPSGRIKGGVPAGGIYSQSTQYIPNHQVPPGGMRTDRHNNPTAIMYEGFDKMFESIGYKPGVDFTRGDAFPENPDLHTIRFNSPEQGVQAAIDLIDNFGFYTQAGQPRWTHTSIPQSQWSVMNDQQKRNVIKKMYKNEGGSGEIFNEKADFSTGPFTTEADVRSLAVKQRKSPKEVEAAVANFLSTGELPRGEALNATQTKNLSDGESAIRVMESVKNIIEGDPEAKIFGVPTDIGPFRGLTTDIPLLGRFDIPIQKKQADLKRAIQLVGRFMEGGVLRREDEIKYEKMLPNVKDLPSVARSKWNGVMDMLVSKYRTDLDSMENAGFDIVDSKSFFEENLASLAPNTTIELLPENQPIQFKTIDDIIESGDFTEEEIEEIKNS